MDVSKPVSTSLPLPWGAETLSAVASEDTRAAYSLGQGVPAPGGHSQRALEIGQFTLGFFLRKTFDIGGSLNAKCTVIVSASNTCSRLLLQKQI